MPTLEGTPRLETETVLMLVGKALLGFSSDPSPLGASLGSRREMLLVNSWVWLLEVVLSELELGVATGVVGSALEGVERLTAVTPKLGALETSAGMP
jgi:hypothetical protein